MPKVNLEVLKPWITKRLGELLDIEDDVVIEFVFNQLEEKVKQQFEFFFFVSISIEFLSFRILIQK